MKIAYLNPWSNAAENQAFKSLEAGGKNIGVQVLSCQTPSDVEESGAEFVLSVASSVPKIADIPSYLTVHEPTKRFMTNKLYLNNLLSYDGFLTISDTLARFVKDVSFGIGRFGDVGFYYNTPQQSGFTANLENIVRRGELKLVYLGTNWDQRLPALFNALDDRSLLCIHGPEASWKHSHYKSYMGPLPFDGSAPQKAYSECGMGLVLLSADHLTEDVISNRIFEISSVGAVAICPDIPWIRKWFGDSVLYYSPSAPVKAIAEEILEHYQFCSSVTNVAWEKALRARDIFERHFSAEHMLGNAVNYHEKHQKWKAHRRSRLGSDPRISVVVRCGGRPVSMVKSAIDSIRRQTFGKFIIIFAKYAEIDLADVVNDRTGCIVEFREVYALGGNRYTTLATGLEAVDSEYFAILDDDDFWLSDHTESLFSACHQVCSDFDVAFSGTVSISDKGTEIETNLFWNRNIYTFGFRDQPQTLEDVTREFSSHCFVARSELIPASLLELPSMETAEDSLIVALVTRRMRPIFSYKATAFFDRSTAGSSYASAPSRKADMISLNLRAGMLYGHQWLNIGSTKPLFDGWGNWAAIGDNGNLASRLPILEPPKNTEHYQEHKEMTHLMSVGIAGIRDTKGFAANHCQEGCVCFGPYVRLPADTYELELTIEHPATSVGLFDRLKKAPIGSFDIISIEADWVGPIGNIYYTTRIVEVQFAVPNSVSGKPVEFRVHTKGRRDFCVRAVRLRTVNA